MTAEGDQAFSSGLDLQALATAPPFRERGLDPARRAAMWRNYVSAVSVVAFEQRATARCNPTTFLATGFNRPCKLHSFRNPDGRR